MQNKVRNYLFFSMLLCMTVVGGYSVYSAIGKYLSLGLDEKTLSMALQLKEYDEDKLFAYNPPAQRTLDILNYDIKIDLNLYAKIIHGDVLIKMKLNDSGNDLILLNFYNNMEIKELEVNGQRVKYEQGEEILTIYKPNNVNDSALVRIVYTGSPKSLGFGSFNFETNGGNSLIYTMNEPIFASTWFPCIDHPDDKALMDIHITNDSNFVSLSNGKLIDVKNHGNKKTYSWKTYYPIATYLVAIYSGTYKSFSDKMVSSSKDSINIDYYAFPNDLEKAKHDFEDHPEYIRVFEELFGPYPFAKEKYSVAEFLWQSGAMEHQTLTGIGSNFVTGRKFFSDILIHELAHHWWGNAVSPKTWKDVWLNEGFATYSEALYWEKAAGFGALQSTLRSKNGSFETGTLYDPGESLFSSLVYNKGAWVLHMLRKEVGDINFFEILHRYFEEYKYKNASTNDFKNICERIGKKNLSKFFEQWIYKGEGKIQLNYDWAVTNKSNALQLELNCEQIQKKYNCFQFPLDLKIVYQDGSIENSTVYIGKREEKFVMPVQQQPREIILDNDKWLLAEFSRRESVQ